MKKLTILIAFVGLALVATRPAANLADAQAEQVSGLYVFIKAKPTSTFKYLGTVKGPTFSNPDFDTMFPKMLKKVQEEYPQANGVIFNGEMSSSEKYRVDAIKLGE
jgi:hypothetical protein